MSNGPIIARLAHVLDLVGTVAARREVAAELVEEPQEERSNAR